MEKSSEYSVMHLAEWMRKHELEEMEKMSREAVELTIWIHNGETEVLFGGKAVDKFNEYNKYILNKRS